MVMFVLGLLLFLGVHSTRVFADGWRTATIARIGDTPWKAVYSVLSIAAFVLLVWGYGQARQQLPLWQPPAFTRHVTALLMLPVFVLFVAAYVPRNGIKARLGHPQVLSVKLWALAHLLSNGNLADVLLFGGFLAWAVLSFKAAKQRDRAIAAAVHDPWNAPTGIASLSNLKTVSPQGTVQGTVICVVLGLAIYAAFVFGLHQWLIGVRPV
jgi:uncharacterized membrane protein